VAALVTTLLDQGTTRMPAREVADLIDTVGGALDTGTGRDLISAHVTVMKDSFDLGLKLSEVADARFAGGIGVRGARRPGLKIVPRTRKSPTWSSVASSTVHPTAFRARQPQRR
jgi:hypothetical protein